MPVLPIIAVGNLLKPLKPFKIVSFSLLDDAIPISLITFLPWCEIYSNLKFNLFYLRIDWVNEFFQFVWFDCWSCICMNLLNGVHRMFFIHSIDALNKLYKRVVHGRCPESHIYLGQFRMRSSPQSEYILSDPTQIEKSVRQTEELVDPEFRRRK